jgi:hypothetical protein
MRAVLLDKNLRRSADDDAHTWWEKPVISHEHKVIFVHVPKTGGQSVEQMFLDELGLNWEDRAPLLLRPNADPTIGPQRLAHLYADEYVRLGHISQENFDSYFKFAVVRNPYDRLVSEYLYRYQNKPFWRTPSPSRFLKQRFDTDFSDRARHLVPQVRYVTDGQGNMLVDHIIKFENMGAQFEELSERIFGTRRALPHRNKTKTDNKARKLQLRKRVQLDAYRLFKADFDAFDYTP